MVFGTEYPFRTVEACFLHRVPLKTRRVHQEPLYGTARPFRTPGGPLRYRMLPRQKEKDLACAEFLKLPEKKKPLQKAQPGMQG